MLVRGICYVNHSLILFHVLPKDNVEVLQPEWLKEVLVQDVLW